jgi:hypothetical protein
VKAGITERDIRGALVAMRSFADDLPDGMLDGVEEIQAAFAYAKETGRDVDVPGMAAWIRELCNEYGLPAPLPEEGV